MKLARSCTLRYMLASFFLPSHLSFKNMYMYVHVRTQLAGEHWPPWELERTFYSSFREIYMFLNER